MSFHLCDVETSGASGGKKDNEGRVFMGDEAAGGGWEEEEEHALHPSVSPYLFRVWQQRAAADVVTRLLDTPLLLLGGSPARPDCT